MGLWFLYWSARGMANAAGDAWARKFFVVSLVYLPVLVVGLMVDLAIF